MYEIAKVIQLNISKKINSIATLSDFELHNEIANETFSYLQKNKIETAKKILIADKVYKLIRGMGVIQPLIEDQQITDIMINGPHSIYIEKNGKVSKSELEFSSEKELNDLIQKIISGVNRVVNRSTPIVDARMEDGSRLNVVLNPIAVNGPIVTIRKFSNRAMTLEQLVEKETITNEMKELLTKSVIEKKNIFISGGTGAGKTTLLNSLAKCIDKNERIITIEDSAELKIEGIENLVTLETRNFSSNGKGEITIRDLIKTALRMRPDRIIIGEIRGAEALDMLQAMNTGHSGSISTGHANSAYDLMARIETMVLEGCTLPIEAIKRQISLALDIIVHISKNKNNLRKVVDICKVGKVVNGQIEIKKLI